MLEILHTDFKISKGQWQISIIFRPGKRFNESKHTAYQKLRKQTYTFGKQKQKREMYKWQQWIILQFYILFLSKLTINLLPHITSLTGYGCDVIEMNPLEVRYINIFTGPAFSVAWLVSSGEGNGNPFLYPCLGNPMDRGAWWAMVHGVARVRHDLATKQLGNAAAIVHPESQPIPSCPHTWLFVSRHA